MINAAINYIGRANGVSLASRAKYFRRMDVLKIRRWLRDHGLNSHMTIEAFSTEIALKTPEGVVMQIRSGENCLGFFGGELNPDEKPVEGAQRELFEETGLWLEEDEFVPKEIYSHHHTYPSGDRVYYHTYRYVVSYPTVPLIEIDNESKGFVVVKHSMIKDHVDFLKKVLDTKIPSLISWERVFFYYLFLII